MLARLVVRDYRNIAELDLEVPSAGMVVIGDNGHGKTNLLEAVAYLGLLRSFRGARDLDVIRFGAPAFHVRATLAAPAAWHTVSVAFERATRKKRATLDGVEQPRLASALGALPSVAFSPADVALVTGGPGERRRYLDLVLALSQPPYLAALQQYRAALQRRNAVLRLAQREHPHSEAAQREQAARVSVWEPALIAHGALIVSARQAFVRTHHERYQQLCAAIGEPQPASLRYQSTGGDNTDAGATSMARQAEALAAAFDQHRRTEIRRGVTMVGPHRDDLHLQLGARDLRTFGSAGQQRSAAIALRLLELATLRAALGYAPLLLLDDPFAELDMGRAARVLALLGEAGAQQVLLTVPREADIPGAFTRLPRVVMTQGTLGAWA